MYYKICSLLVLETLFFVSYSLPTEENSKFLGASNQNQLKLEERKLGDRRKKPTNQGPCNFGYRRNPKSNDIASGRTFFDLQYYNIEHNFNYNINCGGQGGGGYEPFQGGAFGGHKPIIDHKPVTEHGGIKPGGGGLNLGGHHKPHKPSGGGHFQGGNGGGFLENRPVLSNWLANRPLQGLFSQSQSQSQSQAGSAFSEAPSGPSRPQQIALGLSEGIQSFVGTLPQIGQSFLSLLPSFDNFQLPQLPSGIFSNPFDRPQAPSPPVIPPVDNIATPIPVDPDIIYNDEIKPVNEEHDAVDLEHINKLPPDNHHHHNTHNLPPGQYLTISNPHLGSYTSQDLTPVLDQFKPNKIWGLWQQGVHDLVEEFLY